MGAAGGEEEAPGGASGGCSTGSGQQSHPGWDMAQSCHALAMGPTCCCTMEGKKSGNQQHRQSVSFACTTSAILHCSVLSYVRKLLLHNRTTCAATSVAGLAAGWSHL